MDYWNGLSFFSPAKELTIYIEELSLAHAGLACNVVLARAFPRDIYSGIRLYYRAFSSWAWLIFITCCGKRVFYAESSKLGKLISAILNDLQLIVRSYKYLNI